MAGQMLSVLEGDARRPAAERIGMPVRFVTTVGAEGEAPARIPRDDGPVLAVVIAGAALLASDEWRTWARETRAVFDDGHVGTRRFLVLATSPAALGAPEFGTISALRLLEGSADARARAAIIGVLAAAADLLVDIGERVRVFISHAKADGREIADAFDARVADAKLGSFLDSHRITEGTHFDRVIDDALEPQRSAFVAIVTDAYASREWCRIEALRAKRYGLPYVVLDAVREQQERSLAYMGNVPVLRLGDDRAQAYDATLIALLSEVVRARWFPRYVDGLGVRGPSSIVLARPPELLMVSEALATGPGIERVIYPEPPLSTEELEVLRHVLPSPMVPAPEFLTPTELRSGELR